MLEYDISEVIYITKNNYSYFLDKDFKYAPYFCNGCHDLMQKAMNFNDVIILSL